MDINSKIKLNNGIEIPAFGFGTYQTVPGPETYDSVRYALEIGYRLIDTAAFYGNEADVGKAIRDSKINRNEIFVTTKVKNTDQGFDNTLKAFDVSFNKLNIDYIDLYLIHWPLPNFRNDTWKALEKIYQNGKVKSIGVSNFTINHLNELFSTSAIIPVVNQVEFHIYLYQKELLEFCTAKGIYLEAYSPLVQATKMNDAKLKAMATKYNKTAAQILIKWALQVGTIPLPKSITKHRIKENAEVFDFEISVSDMEQIENWNENLHICWNPNTIK